MTTWMPPHPEGWRYGLGDRVRKIKGAQWQGRVVGFYSTEITPEGYAIESERERGSVQIYPLAALEPVPSDKGGAEPVDNSVTKA